MKGGTFRENPYKDGKESSRGRGERQEEIKKEKKKKNGWAAVLGKPKGPRGGGVRLGTTG